MTFDIDAGQIFRFIIKHCPLLVITFVISVAAGYIYTSEPAVDIYEAKAIIYCPGSSSSEINAGIRVITINGEIINSDKVAEDAKLNLSFNMSAPILSKSVKLFSKINSAVYTINALSAYPERAIEITNAIADAFVRKVSGESGVVSVYEYAVKAEKKIDGKIQQRNNMIIIPTISVAGAVGAIVLYAMLFGKVRSVAEAALCDRSNIFGVILRY